MRLTLAIMGKRRRSQATETAQVDEEKSDEDAPPEKSHLVAKVPKGQDKRLIVVLEGAQLESVKVKLFPDCSFTIICNQTINNTYY